MKATEFSVFRVQFSDPLEQTRPTPGPSTPVFSVASVVNSSAIGRTAASAFTLLEVLAAVTVLAMMMAFMFSLLGSSLTLWETGNRRIEAAQAARVGLNIMANDLKNAFAGNMTSYTSSGTGIQNIAPFMALGNNTLTAMDLGGGASNAAGSQQIAGVMLTGNASMPFNEFGFMSVFLNDQNGREPMIGDRYYLVKKLDSVTSGDGGDFYFRNTAPNLTWQNSSSAWYPIIDNCIRLTFNYYGNATSSEGAPGWSPTWPPTDRLPLGVLVTATVLDSRTAEKIASITTSPIPREDIDAIFTTATPANTTQRQLRQGAVTVRRFIPFNRN
jgi:hypothetical protein